ncbi:hypothetical protein CXB51_009793 [Gossypium anomalum]|uniref:Uncharacterized protein n=1 Tax=Gossypium anomalum TaxID=47600 RepID=A0A8J6D1N4_9ROSI|nr:hypothetical protein CXB51_009793 [Gossypium anomalum]
MENFLQFNEYWKVIEHDIVEPIDGEKLIEAQQKGLGGAKAERFEAKNYLFQAIDRLVPETIFCKGTFKDIWYSMKTKYQGSSRMNDKTIDKKILRFLSLKYDYVVCSIEESKDIDALTLNELQSSMLEETKVEEREETDETVGIKMVAGIPDQMIKANNGIENLTSQR